MIARIEYTEMRCDHPRCRATLRVWEGRSLDGWTIRTEGQPWDGKTGGYHECHYCPSHTPAPVPSPPTPHRA